MTHLRNADFAPTHAHTGPAEGALGRTGRAIAAWLRRWRQSRADDEALVALASMDAHLLRDIGADRADLGRLVRHGRP